MSTLLNIAETALRNLKDKGAQKAQVVISESEMQELSIENNQMSLLRSTFDQGVSMKAIRDHKHAVMGTNQFDNESLQVLADSVMTQTASANVDEAYDISPAQEKKTFLNGLRERNDDWAYDKLMAFIAEVKTDFPKTLFESAVLKFVKTKRVLLNSNGTHFESDQGYYEFGNFFTSKDGKKASSFNYSQCLIGLTPAPLMDLAGTKEIIRQSNEQIHVQKIPGKFEGDLIITPHCLTDFIGTMYGYLGLRALLTGSSIYKDKLGQRIASEKVTLRSRPLDQRFVANAFWTADGFLTQNQDVLDKGVLKTFQLDLYGANKLKKERSLTDASHLIVEPGDKSLKEMISSVKKGILLGRFSGGNPAENGDFSGVAKNSYYIENGEIKYPVGETMISGNVAKLFMDIQDISKESIDYGSRIMPWVKTTGITVS